MEEYKIGFNWKNIGQIMLFLILAVAVIIGIGFLDNVLYKKEPEITATMTDSTQLAEGELQIEDIKEGTGVEVKNGDTVSVHYKGTLTDGKQFDASYDRNQPFDFTVGESQVIEGWHQGLVGMKVGGKRKLTIPPNLGYGEQGSPPVIPPNSTLVFEIELLEIK